MGVNLFKTRMNLFYKFKKRDKMPDFVNHFIA